MTSALTDVLWSEDLYTPHTNVANISFRHAPILMTGAWEQDNEKMRTSQTLFAGGQECVLISWAPGTEELQAPKLISNTF